MAIRELLKPMKPLKLYTRTTILVSAILMAVLLAVVYFFISKAKDIELQDQESRAKLWATELANQLPNQSPQASQDLFALRNYALLFRTAHEATREGQIQRIRIYGVTKKGLIEVITLPPAEPEEISARDLAILRSGEP